MRVLVACEFSGVVRDAFRRRGHDAWSCDLEDVAPEGEFPNYHLFGDARWFLGDATSGPIGGQPWDLLIAHPPCTYLANSGVRWLHEKPGRWEMMRAGAALFLDFLNAPIPRIAVENPVMHRYARDIVGRGPDFTVQPWQFGVGETKRTCFWTKNLPDLVPTEIVSGRAPKVHYEPPGPDRGKRRSVTCAGIAEAMAAQWGGLNQ